MKTGQDPERALLEGVAAACGVELAKVAEININFKAPNPFAIVTIRQWIGPELREVADTFTLTGTFTGARRDVNGASHEVDAASVAPGHGLYVVTSAPNHKTLHTGDEVRMVESSDMDNLLLRTTDWTLHDLRGELDQYVHLRSKVTA